MAIHNTYTICPEQTFGHAGTHLGRAAVRDPRFAGRDLLITCSLQLLDGDDSYHRRARQTPEWQNGDLMTCLPHNFPARAVMRQTGQKKNGYETDTSEEKILCDKQESETIQHTPQVLDGDEAHRRRAGQTPQRQNVGLRRRVLHR